MGVEQIEVRRAARGVERRSRSRAKPLIEGFKLHRAGLEIEDWVDQRTWYEFGKLLQQADYGWEWLVADWLAFGDHKYGDQVYKLAARLLGKAPRTWEDYAYIARNVRFPERSEILPVLTHKPVARFGDDPKLQRKLLAIAEQHALSKAVFEKVIVLEQKNESYRHLLPAQITPLTRAAFRAEQDRDRVRKRVLAEESPEWLEFARSQADSWRRLVEELSRLSRERKSGAA